MPTHLEDNNQINKFTQKQKTMKKNRLLLLTLLLLNGIVFSQPLPVQHSRHANSSKKMMSPAQKMSFPINPSAIIFTDNMDGDNTVAGLVGRGYATYYRGGGPPGLFPEWFQGDSTAYASYNGPDSGYVTSTFNSVTGANSIDNWLVLPAQNVVAGDSFSFFARSPTGSTFVDSARVMYNPSGATLPEDINWVQLDKFKSSNLGWQRRKYAIPTTSATGVLAIRHAVANSGPTGLNGDLLGIDQIDVFNGSTPLPPNDECSGAININSAFGAVPVPSGSPKHWNPVVGSKGPVVAASLL